MSPTEPLVLDIPDTSSEPQTKRLLTPEERNEEATLQALRPLIVSARERRQAVESSWLLSHHAWSAIKTRFFYTEGTADHYIPAMRRAIERFIIRCRTQLIPSAQFFEVYPAQDSDQEQGKAAENVQAFLLYILTTHIKLRDWLDQILRTYCLYGRAIVKNQLKIIHAPVTLTDGPSKRSVVAMLDQVWPTSRVVDPFNFYTWPETATTIDDIQVMFEDVMLPWQSYQELAESGMAKPLQYEDIGRPTWPHHVTIRLGGRGFAEPSTTQAGSEKGQQTAKFVHCSEVWFRRSGRWQTLWIVWNVSNGPLVVRYKPTPLPEPPYRMAFARQLPGETYTNSMGSDLEALQVWLNDEINITEDGRMTSMSPPVLMNPAAIFRPDSIVFRPRAKWIVDPSGVEFPTIPDTTGQGLQGVQMVLGFMDSFSGSNPLAEGQPTRGMPRAGFAVSSLISLSLSDIKSVAEIIEDDILTPTLRDLHRLGAMFIPDNQRIKLPAVMGLKPRDLSIDALFGDWSLRWVGTLQSQEIQVKSQRLLTLFGLMVKAAPMMQQGGIKVDWITFMKRLWRDSLGERGADSILQGMNPEDAIMAMLMQGKLMSPNGQPGGPGGGQPMTPGAGANPATAEGAQRADGRNMTESMIGQLMGGLGNG